MPPLNPVRLLRAYYARYNPAYVRHASRRADQEVNGTESRASQTKLNTNTSDAVKADLSIQQKPDASSQEPGIRLSRPHHGGSNSRNLGDWGTASTAAKRLHRSSAIGGKSARILPATLASGEESHRPSDGRAPSTHQRDRRHTNESQSDPLATASVDHRIESIGIPATTGKMSLDNDGVRLPGRSGTHQKFDSRLHRTSLSRIKTRNQSSDPQDATASGSARDDPDRLHATHGRARHVSRVNHAGETASQLGSPSQHARQGLSLMQELFPEVVQSEVSNASERAILPKLQPPSLSALIRRTPTEAPRAERQHIGQSHQTRVEQTTVLQLLYCSTELTEADLRQIVPKGSHIESWVREGDFTRVIAGRNPLSLERLPFYYLLFDKHDDALAYQKNAAKLHKLSQLHQADSLLSAIPSPAGLLENGEDIHFATTSYLLQAAGIALQLHVVMQPYNPSLSEVIRLGGYKPIVPSQDAHGQPIYKVLLQIGGYEPTARDLWHIFSRDAAKRGLRWCFRNEARAFHRLRDIANVDANFEHVSSANPRAVHATTSSRSHGSTIDFFQTSISSDDASDLPVLSEQNAKASDETLTRQLYNRWIIEFEEKDAARRFASIWNRRVLPFSHDGKLVSWREAVEPRLCSAEYLW